MRLFKQAFMQYSRFLKDSFLLALCLIAVAVAVIAVQINAVAEVIAQGGMTFSFADFFLLCNRGFTIFFAICFMALLLFSFIINSDFRVNHIIRHNKTSELLKKHLIIAGTTAFLFALLRSATLAVYGFWHGFVQPVDFQTKGSVFVNTTNHPALEDYSIWFLVFWDFLFCLLNCLFFVFLFVLLKWLISKNLFVFLVILVLGFLDSTQYGLSYYCGISYENLVKFNWLTIVPWVVLCAVLVLASFACANKKELLNAK
ncbi:MAG: hypothetical protein LBM65_02685 [Oscillospiraceae bacterium]|nr:hypothetical protein [Oscillospiraceae bacterium]